MKTTLLQVTCDAPGCIALENIDPQLQFPPEWFHVEQIKVLDQVETEQGVQTQVQRVVQDFCSLPCLVQVHGQAWLEQAQESSDEVIDFGKAFTGLTDVLTGRAEQEAPHDHESDS